jgi:hypothetical protein
MTSKNKACPICDNTAKRGKRPTSMAYILEITEEGLGIAVAREEQIEALEAAGMPVDWEEAESAPAASEPEEASTPAPEPEAAPAPAEEPAAKPKRTRRTKAQMAAARAAAAAEEAEQETAPVEPQPQTPEPESPNGDTEPNVTERRPAKRGAGRPKVGLTVMIGAMYLRGMASSREVLSSSEVLARFGAELAEDMGAESYWLLDTWKRRERLAEKADYIVSSLAGSIIVHPGELGNDDIGTLMRSLTGVSEGIEAVIGRVG